jgi:caa(3)-type oxidase subunit IV
MNAETPQAFDPNDPHHFGDLGEHHGHHITSAKMLVTVILMLVVFTALTVFASQFETYLTTELGWFLPDIVNVAIAMSIALVKGVLVLMFFMALKYENPLYTIVLLFCLFAFVLFLALTGLDLDNRGLVYHWKGDAITIGGIGGTVMHGGATIRDDHGEGGKVVLTADGYNGPLTEYLKAKYIATTGISEEEYLKRWAHANHIDLVDESSIVSDANRSIPRIGLSGALDETGPEAETDQGGGH